MMQEHRVFIIGYLQLDIMDSIENGVVEPPEIAEDIGRTRIQVWDSLGTLIRRGLAVQTRPPKYGGKAGCSAGAYALTDMGRREYQRALRAGRAPGVPRAQEGD
jgi:hypothetical protein